MPHRDTQTSDDDAWQEVPAQQDPKGPGEPEEPEEPGEPELPHFPLVAGALAAGLATAVGIYIALARRRSST